MFLSIIIPVFNVEEFIWDCLNSVFTQDIPSSEYEVIIVNDGSTDNSKEVIEKFLKSKGISNCILIDQVNQGLSYSRNVGINTAQGKYLWFIDSDDYIKDNCLKTLQLICERDEPELISITTIMNDGSGRIINRNIINDSLKVFPGEHIYNKSWKYPYSGAQFYIYNREWILNKQILFYTGIVYEDLLFVPRVLAMANKCINLNYPIYYYRVRQNSITSVKLNPKHISSLFTIIQIYLSDGDLLNQRIINDMIGRLILRINSMLRESQDKILLKSIAHKYEALPSLKRCVFKSKSFRNIIGWITVGIKTKYLLSK